MASKRQLKRADGSIAWSALFRRNGRQSSITFDTARARDNWVDLADQIGVEGPWRRCSH